MNYNESNLKINIQNITLNYVIKQNSSNYLTCQVLKKKSQNILNQIIMQVRFVYFTYRKYFLSNNNASKYIIIYGNQQNLSSMGNLFRKRVFANVIKDLQRKRSSWIAPWALNQMISIIKYPQERFDRQKLRRKCDYRGRDWKDASQPRNARSHRKQKKAKTRTSLRIFGGNIARLTP